MTIGNTLVLPIEFIKEVAPEYASELEQQGLTELEVTKYKMPEHLLEGLCEKFGGEDGFFTRCRDHSSITELIPTDDPDAFCAWLKDQCHGQDWRSKPRAEKSMSNDNSHTGVMVAFFLDEDSANSLAVAQGESPENLHITLSYLGDKDEIDPEKLNALPHLVRKWAEWAIPLHGEVTGIGRFVGDDNGLTPIFADVDVPNIHELRHDLVSYLADHGLNPQSKHEFNPHITLRYIPANDPSSISTVETTPLIFNKVSVAIGDERHDFPLGDSSVQAFVEGPVYRFADDEQIAYAPVLIPGQPDSDVLRGEKELTEEEIGRVMRTFMEKYQNIDLEHSLNNINAKVVENWQLEDEKQVVFGDGTAATLPKGTWIMGTKFFDRDIWNKIKSMEIPGYSMMGIPSIMQNKVVSLSENPPEQQAAYRRTMIRDLGDDWIVPFVSITESPAMSRSKWFAFRSSKEQGMEQHPVYWEGRKFSEKSFKMLRNAFDALRGLLEEAEAERSTENENDESEENNVDRDEIINTISEQVNSAMQSFLGEKPIDQLIDEKVEMALQSREQANSSNENETENEDTEELKKQVAALQSEIHEITDQVSQRLDKYSGGRTSGRVGETENKQKEATEPVYRSRGKTYKRDPFGRARTVD